MRMQGCNSNGELLSSMVAEHAPVRYADDTPSMTRQEFAKDCDINVLMAHYDKNAIVPPMNSKEPQYFDASSVPDFREALDIAREANEAFMRVPAIVRKELDNDVHEFVKYAADPANVDNMRKWGLAEPAPVETAPMRVQVVSPPTSDPPEA